MWPRAQCPCTSQEEPGTFVEWGRRRRISEGGVEDETMWGGRDQGSAQCKSHRKRPGSSQPCFSFSGSSRICLFTFIFSFTDCSFWPQLLFIYSSVPSFLHSLFTQHFLVSTTFWAVVLLFPQLSVEVRAPLHSQRADVPVLGARDSLLENSSNSWTSPFLLIPSGKD